MKKILVLMVLGMLFCLVGIGICEKMEEPTQTRIAPKKVEVDTNYDGKIDRTEYYDSNGQIGRVEVDSDSDGVIEEQIYYENGKPVKSARDTNKDGKPDIWMEF